jgi:hypothetical protein
MARLGEPLSKTLVMNLANDLISDTDYQEWVTVFKACHKIRDGKAILKCHKTKVKDVKHHTWVTEENFQAMYNNMSMRRWWR